MIIIFLHNHTMASILSMDVNLGICPNFEWKMCPTLTVGSIFTRVRSTFCSFVQQLELRKFKILEPQKRVQNENKNKKDIQNLENTLGSPFFSTLCDFFNCFGFHQRVPLQLFRYFATQWISKNPIVSPFTYFGAVTLLKNLLQKFFGSFLMSPKAPLVKDLLLLLQLSLMSTYYTSTQSMN